MGEEILVEVEGVRKGPSVNEALLLKRKHREGVTHERSRERALQNEAATGANPRRPENA